MSRQITGMLSLSLWVDKRKLRQTELDGISSLMCDETGGGVSSLSGQTTLISFAVREQVVIPIGEWGYPQKIQPSGCFMLSTKEFSFQLFL